MTGSGGYLERPAPSGLADVVEVILDRGIVIDAYVRVSLLGIELVTLDARVLTLTFGLSLLTSVLFGLIPAVQASRLDVNAALTESGSRGVAGGSRQWPRRMLVITEVALGVALLVTTGLLIRTFVNLRGLTPGFDPSGLVTASVSLQGVRYNTAGEINQLFDESLRRLRATPGIEGATVSLELP